MDQSLHWLLMPLCFPLLHHLLDTPMYFLRYPRLHRHPLYQNRQEYRNRKRLLLLLSSPPPPPLKPLAAAIRDEEPRNRWRFPFLLPGDKIYYLPFNRA